MPRRAGLRSLVFAAALSALAAAGGGAQVRGRVTDATGRPLPGVLVELWSAHRRLGGDGTDAQGYFRIPDDATDAAAGTTPRVLLARGVGLEPQRRPLGPRDTLVTLVLEPRAIELEAATVTAEASSCPARDDGVARALWAHAAHRYDVALSALGVSTTTRLFTAIVPPQLLGVIDTAQLREAFILGASTP